MSSDFCRGGRLWEPRSKEEFSFIRQFFKDEGKSERVWTGYINPYDLSSKKTGRDKSYYVSATTGIPIPDMWQKGEPQPDRNEYCTAWDNKQGEYIRDYGCDLWAKDFLGLCEY